MMPTNGKHSRTLLHTTAFIAVLVAHVPGAFADPTGGTVTSGSAGITAAGATTTITQATDRAIIRWDTFNIDASEHVQFVQPNASSITVNRIRDNNPSQINGKISANGNIILINPNGMVFGASSVVDVGGLVATTSDLDDDNAFMAGGAVKFTKPGKPDAHIINNGSMTVRQGGLVGLVAPNVENNGVIQAYLGKVQLASGDIHTIDLAGDGLIKLEISDAVYSQSVKNTGTITADGGSILLTAAQARGLVDTLITNTGTLRANTVTMPDGTKKTGSIRISTHGLDMVDTHVVMVNPSQIINTGTIQASGNALDQQGGDITILADHIMIGDGSVVEASGDTDGGDIRIGGDYQGGNNIPTSDMIYVSDQAILNASSRRRGNGGRIILWSDSNTRFYGHAEATGGAESGNGGLIEVSSAGHLDFNGAVNLLSAHGASGTLLLDPTNISISSAANANVSGSSPFAPNADDVTSVLNVSTLQTALASGNVIVQTRATGSQLGIISVDNALSWTSGNTLTLDAHNAIQVNAAISAGTGSITMIAGADVSLNANVTGSGTITIQQTNDTLTMGIAGGAGTLNLSTADLTRIVDGWGNIVLGRATSTVAMTVNTKTWSDNVTLLSGTGAITIAGTQTMAANNLTITTVGGAVAIGGMAGTTGGLSVSSGAGNISVGTAIATGGAVSLTTTGGNISNTATIGSGALTLASAGGTMTVGGAVTATGITSLNSGAGAMNINAALNSGTNAMSLTTSGTAITTNASGAITAGALTLTTSGGNIATGSTVTTSGVTNFNSGAGTINLGGAINTAANSLSLTTTAKTITTTGITSGALTINSNGANISTGALTTSGIATLTSGNGTISIGAANTGANLLSLTTTGFGITTAAITSGALTLASGGAIINSNGIVTASGAVNITSGGAAVNLNAAFSSGAGTLTITTGGGTLTTLTGAISSGGFTINTGAGNVVIGGNLSATGASTITTTTGTVGITGTTNTGTASLGITTTAKTITTGAITSAALTLNSGGANISTGALTTSGTTSVTSGAGTINVGAISAGANGVTLSSTGFDITTSSIVAGALSITSANGIITTGGTVAATGTTGVNSGTGAMNLNAAFGSTGGVTLTTNGALITKNNTGALTASTLTINTSGGGLSIGTGGATTTGVVNITTGAGAVNVTGTFATGAGALNITTTNNTISLGAAASAAMTLNTSGGGVTLGGTTTTSGILTINSGAGNVSLTGAINSGANAINVTTTGAGTIAKSNNVASTGTITFTTAGGTINLGAGTFGGATGTTSLNSNGGNITIGGTGIVYSTGGTVTMNSGTTGIITVNSVINTGTGSMTINTDTDLALAVTNALSGTGTLTIQQITNSKVIGIGAGQTGDILISATEYPMLKDGWTSIVIGSATNSGGINVAATTWTDSLTLRSNTGVINLAGAQTFANNNFTITTDANVTVGGTISGGTGTFTIQQNNNATTMGIGTGQTGTIAFSDAEVAFMTSNWTNVVFGNTNVTGAINVGTATWNDPMSFRSNTGVITFAGNQTMGANALTITTNADLVLTGTLSGTGALAISTVASSSTTMGFGDSMVGTLNLTNAELAKIMFGWSGITFGSGTAAGAMNVGAYTWDDSMTFSTSSGNITIGATTMTLNNSMGVSTTSGSINMTSAAMGTGNLNLTSSGAGAITLGNATFGTTGNLALTSASGVITLNGATMGNGNITISGNNNVVLGGNISGAAAGTLTFTSATAGATFGIGDSKTGNINLTNAELAFIQSNWGNVVFGATTITGAMNIGNYTWGNANVIFRTSTGVMTIDGATMGVNNLTLSTDSDLAINGAIAGTGTLTIRASNAGVMALGASQTGTVQLSATELGNIGSGWSNVTFGYTGATGSINVGALTFNNNITFLTNTGTININGALQMNAKDLTFTTNADPTIAAGLAGTGNLIFQTQNNSSIIGIAGQTGTVLLSNGDLGNILNGWNTIAFGSASQTGAMNIGAYTWQYDTTFRTSSGTISILGDQAGRNLTFETNVDMVINSALTGTGTLTIRQTAVNSGVTMGLAGATGVLNISTAELDRITDGWDLLVFGRADTASAGTLTVNAYSNWHDDVKLVSGVGILSIAGAQNFGANNATLVDNANMNIGASLTGTGNLAFEGALATTTIGLAGGTGTLALTATELNQIVDGWASQTYGSVTGTGIVTVGAYSWKDNATFITKGNVAVTGAQGSTAGTNLTYASLSGNFVNSGGATPFSTVGAGGRYLIYSTSAATDTYGGMTAPTAINSQTYFGTPPSSIGAGLNRIIYNSGAAKILYLQIDDKSKIYGDTLPSFTYTYLGGLQGGDTLNAAITSATLSASGASVMDDVGTMTSITGIFATALSYTTSVINGTLSVTKAPVLVTAANTSRTYGDANPTFTVNYVGLRNGDTSAVIDSLASASTTATELTNAGTASIDVSGGFDNNYTFNYAPGVLTINKAALTGTTQDATREYGLTNPTFNVVYSGFKNGEDESAITTLMTASSTASATSAVNTYAITATGGSATNYTFTADNSGVLTVTKATLTITTQDNSRLYGVANPTLSVNYSGFRNSDTSSVVSGLSIASAANLTSNAGTYAITSSGASATNYNLVYVDSGVLTVNQAHLTATTQNATREYGLTNPTMSIVYTGFKNGETQSVLTTLGTASSAATGTTGIGTAAITGSGAVAQNYDFTYVDSGVLTITKATLTATTQNSSREYGDANPAMSIVYTGFRNGEDNTILTTAGTASSAASLVSGIGTYTITGGGAAAANYNIVYSNTGILTVTRATVNVTSQNATREYGLANPALTVAYSGFKNGEDTSYLTSMATAATTATATSNVADYTITSSGAAANNYQFNYVNSGLLSVTKATLTATTQNATREYGLANPAMSVIYTGFRNTDTATDLDTQATVSSLAGLTSGVNTYAVTATGAADINYNINYVNTGLLTVTKAHLTATTQDATREYGLANPTLSAVYTGFRNGEDNTAIGTLATVTTGATATSNAGNYGISASGAVAANYDFTYANTGNLSVTKAMLTGTTQNATREYGLANPTLSIVYTGFRNSDSATDIDTQATITTPATVLSDVGSYGISATGAADTNYSFTYVNTGNLSITKAHLIATTQDTTREYGLANPTLSVVYTGFRNSDTQGSIDTLATISTSGTIASDVGTYGVSATGAADTNYDFTYANTGNLSITKAHLTATTQDATREYGLANPTLSVVYTGYRNGDDDTDLDTLATISTLATTASDVGTYGVTATGAADTNYDFTYANTGNLSVAKATLLATTQDATREYGLANPTLSVVYTGYRNGDDDADLNTLDTISTGATLTSGVGTYGITASGGSDNNYTITYANTGLLSVTRANLTVTTQDATREYGLANPTLAAVYTGFRNGETQSVIDTLASISTGATNLSDVGTYGISATGAADGNYSFTYANTGNLSITKAMLTATTQDATREYGLANPPLTTIYTGFRNGQTQSVIDTLATVTTGATTLSDVGSYGISASGAADTNYDFTYANSGTLSVTRATLLATTKDATREYGLANPGLTIVYSGYRNGDDDSDIDTLASASTAATAASNVASYAINASGGLDNNYTITYANTGLLNVTRANLTATTQNTTREYGLANPALNVVYTGFRNGDSDTDIDTLASASTAATSASDVGTYGISANGASDNNYSFTYVNTGNLDITKAMLTATTQDTTREYGLVNPALSVVYTGFRNGQNQSVIDTLASVSTTALLTSDVGTYGITATGAADTNYDFTYANSGNLSVTKATLVATSQNATREYGLSNPTLSVIYTGFRNGDNDGDIDTLANISTSAMAGSDVGSYAIVSTGGLDNNYTITHADSGTLSITKAMLTVSTQDATREYGLANPTLPVVYSGFRNGDTRSVLDALAAGSTAGTAASDVGSYAISAGGGVDNNYDFTYVDGGFLNITKAHLTVTTQDATREYGLANPALSAVYTGFRNGDTESVLNSLATVSTAAILTSNVGSYAISATGASDNNYDITYANTGNLSVTKATLTATSQNATREYGLANPALSLVYTGFRNGDMVGDIDTLGTASTVATSGSDTGTYTVSGSGGLDNNYNFNYADDGTLTITKAHLIGTTQNATREYGLNNPAFGIVYTGFRNGDTSSVLDTDPSLTSTATIGSNVGTYGINAAGAADNNYDFSYANTGTLSVTKASLTIHADDKLREVDEGMPPYTATYTGFRNGDDMSVLDTGPVFSNSANASSPLGDYTIFVSGASDGNYNISFINGALHIVLDSSPPPPPPPVPPVTEIPSTVEHALSTPSTTPINYVFNTPFSSTDVYAPKYLQGPSIVFIGDDEIFSQANDDYLIAISEKLRKEYFGEHPHGE